MSLQLQAISTATPEHAICQHEAAERAATMCHSNSVDESLILSIHEATGVQQRHSCLLQSSSNGRPADTSFYPPVSSAADRGPTTAQRMAIYEGAAAELASQAAEEALTASGHPPKSITHLVTVSCTGFEAPGVDLKMIERLGLSLDVARTHVGFMGCHGTFNGLRAAAAMVKADPRAVVLVSSIELCSLHYQYHPRRDGIVANALFADGSGAVVGCHAPATEGPPWRVIDSRSTIIPGTDSLMSWRVGDYGFEMTLSAKVPIIIQRRLRPWIEAWLAEHDLKLDQVDSWAVHPGGPRILDACATALDLAPHQLQASRDVLTEFGNMSSATILFILKRLQLEDAPRPCVALAFGPGLTVEAALIR